MKPLTDSSKGSEEQKEKQQEAQEHPQLGPEQPLSAPHPSRLWPFQNKWQVVGLLLWDYKHGDKTSLCFSSSDPFNLLFSSCKQPIIYLTTQTTMTVSLVT